MLSLLYGPTLTSVHDCWKNPSFDYMDLCQQNILRHIDHDLNAVSLAPDGATAKHGKIAPQQI